MVFKTECSKDIESLTYGRVPELLNQDESCRQEAGACITRVIPAKKFDFLENQWPFVLCFNLHCAMHCLYQMEIKLIGFKSVREINLLNTVADTRTAAAAHFDRFIRLKCSCLSASAEGVKNKQL